MMIGLRIKESCLPLVETVIKRRGFLTNADLANEIGVTAATAGKFRKGIPISKNNFCEFCHCLDLNWQEISAASSEAKPPAPFPPEPPEGVIPVEANYYISRSPQEETWYSSIEHPSALLRICGPRQFGKSSLARRILDRAHHLGHKTLYCSCRELQDENLTDTTTFLGWFYSNIAFNLGLPQEIQKYKDLIDLGYVGSGNAFLNCFASYLLPKCPEPITLCIDKLDRLLLNPTVAKDFFTLLRVMHEKTKTDLNWQNFRLILVYASEDIESLVPLDINQSPFNVGTVINLPEFTPEQIMGLAKTYQLNWTIADIQQLMNIVGGLPFFVHLTIHALATAKISPGDLTPSHPIYQPYLAKLHQTISHHPHLLTTAQTIAQTPEPISIAASIRNPLQNRGVIKVQSDRATLRCNLFRHYFSQSIAPETSRDPSNGHGNP
jgi:DNA-binding Xre family transcriptional regulator